MKYEYQCVECRWIIRSDQRANWLPCPNCGARAQRQWGFTVSIFQPHFSHATGTEISSAAQHRSHLARASEQTFLRTGVEANYQPVDWRDKTALGVTNDGLDATYDALKREGRDDQARRLKRLMDE